MQRKTAFSLLMLLAFGLFFMKINMPLTDGDSAYYGKIARNMVESGNWQTLNYRGADLVDKPPLTMWLMAASYKYLGFGDWASRGWHALMAVGIVALTYAIARMFYPVRTSLLAGMVLLTSMLFFYSGIVPQQDVPVLFFYTLAFYGFLRFAFEGRRIDFYLIWIATALAVLTRGLVGMVFPAGVVIAYLLALRLFRLPKRELFTSISSGIVHTAIGIVIFLAIASPWFVLEYLKHGKPFFDLFFGVGNSRFYQTRNNVNEIVQFLAYFPLIIAAFVPWSGFLWHSLQNTWKDMRTGVGFGMGAGNRRMVREGALFLLVWFAGAFLLPFIIKWRVMRYLLPALPPLAIMTGRFLDPLFDSAPPRYQKGGLRAASIATMAVVLPLLAGIIFLALREFAGVQKFYVPLVVPFLGVLLVGLLLFSGLGLARKGKAAVAALVVSSALSYGVLLMTFDANAETIFPWRAMAAMVNQAARTPDKVVIFSDGEQSFISYYVQKPAQVVGDPQEMARLWTQPGRTVFCFTDRQRYQDFKARFPGLNFRVLRENPTGAILISNQTP